MGFAPHLPRSLTAYNRCPITAAIEHLLRLESMPYYGRNRWHVSALHETVSCSAEIDDLLQLQ